MKRFHLFLLIGALLAVCLFLGTAVTAAALGEEHEVAFYLSPGVPYEGAAETVADGACATVPATPMRAGSVFLYWKNGEEKFSFKTPVTEDLSLMAEWYLLDEGVVVAETYDVDFVVDGVSVNTQTIKAGADAIAPTAFALPEGKTFVRWEGTYTDVHADTTVTAVLTDSRYVVTIYGFNEVLLAQRGVVHGGSIDIGEFDTEVEHYLLDTDAAEAALTNITEDKEVYLVYTPRQYDVTCYVGEEQYGDVQTVDYGATARFPDVPQRDGYIFIGWYRDLSDNAMYNFGAPVEDNLDLYAKYLTIENRKYSVKFFNYDFTQYGGTQMIEEGKTAIVPGTPVREGYTFMGWYVGGSPDAPFDFEAGITEDTEVYALFRIRTYTVTVMDGNTVISEQSVRYGETAITPDVAEKEGYIFVGFDGSFKNITRDTVISTVYRARTYAVMFYDHNYKKLGATQYVEYGRAAVAPNPPRREGYVFVRWQPEFDEITDDIAVFPIYEKIKYTYTYTDGESVFDTRTVEHGDKAPMLTAAKEGYIFLGWYENDDAYDFNTAATRDRTLVARWEEEPEITFTVVFTVDGAEYSRQTVQEGGAAIAPADPVKAGHTFTGWDTAFDAVNGDLTISAEFEINTFTVTFAVGNDVTALPYDYGTTVEAPADPEMEGHRFVGWVTVIGTDYDFTDPVTADLYLTAVFEPLQYTVIFTVEGQTYAVQSVAFGGYASVPGTPFVSGKTFAGWYAEDEAYDFAGTPVTGATTIEARFTVNSYKVYYYVNSELYATEIYRMGDEITPLDEPEHDALVTFSGWIGLPELMPAESVVVTATLTWPARYTISYFIGNTLYKQTTYYEGTDVESEGNAPDTDDYVFVAWVGEPETMPAEDVTVTATLTYYYTVTYYVGNDVYTSQKVLAGANIPAVEAPTNEDWIFDAWQDLPAVMPANDVAVNAKVTAIVRYTVTYLIGNDVYRQVRYAAGAYVAPEGDAPDTDDYVFVAWANEPEIMPAQDVTVTATLRYYYTVTYYVGNDVFTTQKVPEGERIPAVETPTGTNLVFVSWQGLPAAMPAADVTVYAEWAEITHNQVNDFVLREQNGVFTLTLEGDIEVGGFIGYISVAGASDLVVYDTDYADANIIGDTVRFVWSHGENSTDAQTVLSFTAEPGSTATVIIQGIYLFDASGEIVEAAYHINGI